MRHWSEISNPMLFTRSVQDDWGQFLKRLALFHAVMVWAAHENLPGQIVFSTVAIRTRRKKTEMPLRFTITAHTKTTSRVTTNQFRLCSARQSPETNQFPIRCTSSTLQIGTRTKASKFGEWSRCWLILSSSECNQKCLQYIGLLFCQVLHLNECSSRWKRLDWVSEG